MNEIDIIEQSIYDINPELMEILLKDMTTGQNLKWATEIYQKYGDGYYPEDELTIEKVIGDNTRVIQPRVSKSQEEQLHRTRDKAEVFTPAWICNHQNNLIDEQWFNQSDVFNTTDGEQWISTTSKIKFDNGKTWKDYILDKRLEISCGEAPYLVSRYDSVTGGEIPVQNRIGLLDRKFRILNEHITYPRDWFTWAKKCIQSVYGYDYQGDNVLLARENILYTFIDNHLIQLNKMPTISQLLQIGEIIAWNIWQMDGVSYTTPFSKEENVVVYNLLGEIVEDDTASKPIATKIYDWEAKKECVFRNVVNGIGD